MEDVVSTVSQVLAVLWFVMWRAEMVWEGMAEKVWGSASLMKGGQTAGEQGRKMARGAPVWN